MRRFVLLILSMVIPMVASQGQESSQDVAMKQTLTTGNNNLRLSQPASENQGISIGINGKDTEDLAVLHDGDVVSLKLADVDVTSADEVRWQLVLAQSDGGWWISSIDGSKTGSSFVVQPSLFLERPNDEVNKFLALTAKAGIYLVRVSKGNEESVFKITIK